VKKTMTEEKFTGGHENLLTVIVFLVIAVLFIVLEQGLSSNVIQGISILLALVIFFYIGDLLTYIIITEKRNLISKTGFGRGFSCDIYNINKIERTSVFIFKTWGNRLQIYFIDETGQETWRVIQESMYGVKIIKQLLKRLKEINPSIQLDQQYQELIDGKINDESQFKKIRPNQG
jgi:hypothetical protein